jgi:hypothetical protein
VKNTSGRLAACLCLAWLSVGLNGCAGNLKPGGSLTADIRAAKQHFADGRYRESLEGCCAVIASSPDCAILDEALYCAAISSLRAEPGEGGQQSAAQYLRHLAADCPESPLLPEAQAWLSVLPGPAPSREDTGLNELQKKDREIDRLRGEIVRLNRELHMLKTVDMDLHRQKKDLDDGPDERKNTRP